MDPTEYEEQLRRGFFSRVSRTLRLHTRRGRIVAIAATTIASLVLCGWKGGPWFIARAKTADADCSNRNYQKEPGASLACDGRARWWLLPAKLIPWTRKEAQGRELAVLASEQEMRVKLATHTFLDPAMRDSNTDALLQTVAQPGYPADLRRADWVFAIATNAGGRAKTASLGEHAKGGFDRARALRAAVAAGDLPLAMKLAEKADPATSSYDYDLVRGSLLCLLGNKSAGDAALRQANDRHREKISSYSYDEALLGRVACGGPASHESKSFAKEALWVMELLANKDVGKAWRSIEPTARYADRSEDNAAAFFAIAHAGGAIKQPENVVNYAGSIRSNLEPELSAWALRGPRTSGIGSLPIAYDAAAFEASADALLALIAGLERSDVKVKPLPADETLSSAWWRSEKEVRAARKEPIKPLRRLALIMRVNALVMYATSFDVPAVRRAYDKLPQPQTDASVGLMVGSHLARVGELKSARAMFNVAAEGTDSLGRVYALLAIALLDLAEGRPRDAVASATRAAALHAAAHGEVEKSGLASVFDVGKSIGWVSAAAALVAGDATVAAKVATPEYFNTTGGPNPPLPADWFSLARADDAARRLARFRMFSPTLGTEERAVLPAVIYVLREIARDGKVPDVWVDYMIPIHDKDLNGATGLRARGEAARWRGAAEEAKEWDARAQKLEATVTTPQQTLLARMAGLY